MSRSDTTKTRILDAARELFDASGTAAVSTNHIAAAAGISPGNLYYHYKNKEQIVLALIERCARGLGHAWGDDPPRAEASDVASYEAALHRRLGVLAECAFVPRELFALAAHWPNVAERERRLREAEVEVAEATLARLIAAKQLRDPGPGRVRQIAELTWLVGLAALADARLSGDSPQKAVVRAADAAMSLVTPYLAKSPA